MTASVQSDPIQHERHTRALLALIILAGLALRIWMIWLTPLDPRFSNADDGDYYRRALHLAVTGQYIDDAWLIRPPLHVFFFAIWLRLALVTGVPQLGLLFVQLAQTAVSMLSVGVGYACARRLFASERAGLIFAGFLALWYPFVEQPSVLYSELLYIALFLTHLWLLLRYDALGRWPNILLSGVALGAAALTRSPALYSLAFVGLWLVLRPLANRRHLPASRDQLPPTPPRSAARTTQHLALRRVWSAIIAPLALITLGCLVIVLPWTARNYLVYQRFIPVDTLGQINLWLDLDRGENRLRNMETLRGLPQADRAGYALAQVREILAEHPLKPVEGMWPTFQHIWKAPFVEDFYVKQSFFTRPLRETAWLGLIGDLAWVIVTLAGLIGLAAPVREGLHHRVFVLAWLGYSLATVLVFHVEPRYLIPIWTLIGLYGAGVGARLRFPPIGLRLSSLVQVVVIIGFFALLLSYRDYPRIVASGVAREQGYVAAERAYRAADYPAAERGFRSALAAQPGFVDAQVGLALALAAQGRRDEALAILQRGSSRRAELTYGAVARDLGDRETARTTLVRYEVIAGEDVQSWALEWLRPPLTARLTLGDGLDLGYIQGFSKSEQDSFGSFRWLTGSGSIHLPLPAPMSPGATIVLRLTSGRAGPVPVFVQIGSGRSQLLSVQGGQWRSYHLSIPPELVGQTALIITLRAPTFVPALENPQSDDARALSLMIGEIRVQ